MQKITDIRIRDPFVLLYEGVYYLYSSMQMSRRGDAVGVYTSTDLINWTDIRPVFSVENSSLCEPALWAPEVHEYRGRFYLCVSPVFPVYPPKTHYIPRGNRGTLIAVSDHPDGTFVPISDRPATPVDQSCIDGSLYVEDGKPYMVYSHDWPDNYVKEKEAFIGEIAAVQLSEDLREQVGEPFTLFASIDAPFEKTEVLMEGESEPRTRYGSDGPFITKLQDGKLFLIWSPLPNKNYIVAAAVADSIRGPWRHLDKPVFDGNGGHGMIFTTFEGQKKLCIHCPEKPMLERALFLDLEEKDGILRCK